MLDVTFIEDVRSILAQHRAEWQKDAPISEVLKGLRGGWMTNFRPESKRRWTIRGGPVDFIDMLEQCGFVLVKDGQATRVTCSSLVAA